MENESDEPLHLDFEDREIYLVKVPSTLINAWKKVTESDTVLGQIDIDEKIDGNRKEGKLLVDKETFSKEQIPQNYRVDFVDCDLKLKVFSQDGSNRLAVEGIVAKSCNVIPFRNNDYSKLCKQRLLKSMVKERFVKPLEELPRIKRSKVQFTINKPENADTTEPSERPIDKTDKKIKMSKEELKNLIFQLFEEKEFWPLKELNYHCRQTESYLKEVLKEIAVYHRKGPNKSSYELKPQYKT